MRLCICYCLKSVADDEVLIVHKNSLNILMLTNHFHTKNSKGKNETSIKVIFLAILRVERKSDSFSECITSLIYTLIFSHTMI